MNHRVLTATLVLLTACATSPLGRSQLLIFPAAEMDAMGVQAFDQIVQEGAVSRDAAANAYVRCVANAITAVLPAEERGEGWEVVVFDDETANAFALPGRKIGVHTGLLAVATNQDQLATVIGHEVGHVLAHHGNERMSQQFVAQTGLGVAQVLAGEPSPAKDLALGALGLGAQVGILLPFSRSQEREADLLGLDLMAQAGFDSRQSVELWRNMAKGGGGEQPEFLSTHPSHDTRIQDLSQRIPQTLPLYEKARQSGRAPRCS